MLRLLAVITFLSSLIFILLSLVSIAIGNTNPSKPALAGLSICASGSPCWFGIEPNVTRVEEAEQILSDLGYRRYEGYEGLYISSDERGLCNLRYSYSSMIVTHIELSNCPDTQIGDFLIVPFQALRQTCYSSYQLISTQGMTIDMGAYPTTLYDPIYGINLSHMFVQYDFGSQIVEWQGFVPAWRRLNPSSQNDCSYDLP